VVPTFPNARYIFSREEYRRFAPENRTAEPPPFLDIFEDSVLPVIQSGQAEFVCGEQAVHELLTVFPRQATPQVTSQSEPDVERLPYLPGRRHPQPHPDRRARLEQLLL